FAAANQLAEASFSVWSFGDNRDMANELAALVVAGTKRATTSLLRSFESSDEPLPKPGEFGVVVGGDDRPCCIVRVTEVEVKPMGDVDTRFAWDEGEGDRSLDWWLSTHTRFFTREGATEGFAVDRSTEVVLVRFEAVWPRK
ncbi:MAG TPA: ASCH domain-containing protein, partial [Candidatus Cybelea sp.]|nr:ASCH domain-containing protein [Candidatus Cybelea sp.]